MKNILISFILLICVKVYSQDNSFFDRLQAMKSDYYTVFYNVDGYIISSELMLFDFSETFLPLAYGDYNVNSELKIKDSLLNYENYVIKTIHKITDSINEYNSYYFIKNNDKRIIVIQISAINKNDEKFEREFVNLILENKIPLKCYSNKTKNEINFASRKIIFDDNCYYANINAVQCPYKGEVSWSIHKNLVEAKKQIYYQMEITKSKNLGKIVTDEFVNVIFEGIKTKARKVIYDFTNNPDIIASTSGKSMTIYYIAEEVRNNFVSCILSHWDNDKINKSGLPDLLDIFMKLE